jgi:hypothetical protein
LAHDIELRFEIDTGDVIPAGIDRTIEIKIPLHTAAVPELRLAENLFYHPDIVPDIGLRVFMK